MDGDRPRAPAAAPHGRRRVGVIGAVARPEGERRTATWGSSSASRQVARHVPLPRKDSRLLTPLTHPRRSIISCLATAGVLAASALGVSATPATSAKRPVVPELDGKVNYVRAHDGPIDCQRPPTFHAFVFGFVPKRTNVAQIKRAEADYRPLPGGTLTISGKRYSLTLTSKKVSVKFGQISWDFRAVPTPEAVGERAHRAVIRYNTKSGRQTLEAFVFHEGCV
jgi:hypothetical protein